MFRLAFACLAACLASCAGQLKVDDLNVPPGFSVNVYANDTSGARSLAISKNTSYTGTILYVSTDTSVRLHNTFLSSHAITLLGSDFGCDLVARFIVLVILIDHRGGLKASPGGATG